MNDIEKAINVISNLKHLIINIIGNEINEKEFDTAISALEKQIPKKPKRYIDFFKTTYYFCPVCEYVRITGNQKHCDVCGQKIDWRVEE